MRLIVGSEIKFKECTIPYKVMASTDRYAVCVRPIDQKEDEDLLAFEVERGAVSTVEEAWESNKDYPVYTIVDYEEMIRGPHDRIFNGYDFKTEEGCKECLTDLVAEEIFISHRHRIALNVEYIISHLNTNMKTSKDIALEINMMSQDDAIESGAKLIEEYCDKQPLKVNDYTERIEPFLSDKVKSFWKNRPHFLANSGLGKDEEGTPHICFMQVVVTKSLASCLLKDALAQLDDEASVTDTDLKLFADVINKAAEMDLIHTGALGPIGGIRLSVISTARRTILYFYPVTTKLNKELMAMNKVFTKEGDIGSLEIVDSRFKSDI